MSLYTRSSSTPFDPLGLPVLTSSTFMPSGMLGGSVGASGRCLSLPVVSTGSSDGLGGFVMMASLPGWSHNMLRVAILVFVGWPWSRVALAVSTTSPVRCLAHSLSSVSDGSDELSAGIVGSAYSAFGFVVLPVFSSTFWLTIQGQGWTKAVWWSSVAALPPSVVLSPI